VPPPSAPAGRWSHIERAIASDTLDPALTSRRPEVK
jgi:hypothetical protein